MLRALRLPLLLALSLFLLPSLQAAPAYTDAVKPLMEKHCATCHNADKHKGGVDLSGFTDNLSMVKDRKLWHKVVEAIKNGDMPPDDEPAIPDPEKVALLADISGIIDNFNPHDPAFRDPGPSVLRRLSRAEYENSIRELTGLKFDASSAAGISGEDNGNSYDNLAVALTLSPMLMEKYFVAADQLLDRLFISTEERTKDAGQNKQALQLIKEDEPVAKKLLAEIPEFSGPNSATAVRTWLPQFIRKAWRRPATEDEVNRILAIHTAALTAGDAPLLALRKTVKPVLLSPHFIFRVERNRAPEGSNEAYPVTDAELASRLSYFIWSGPPDDELLAAAEKGELTKPEVLEAQVKRMLASPKAEQLTQNFTAHWLHISKIKDARPQQEAYPLFNQDMRNAMRDEMLTFVSKLRTEDRSVLEFLNADYTYVNEPLAKLYGLDGVKGKEMRKVSLPADSPRGGLLGMAGVLTMTSHTNRTSPTLRGKYVLDVIMGTPPALPPNNVSQLKPGKKGEPPKSIREQLAQHAQDSSCAGCHKKIDPLGFALENFDGIGAWRDSTAEVKLDTDGVLPTGEKFNGARELKAVILSKQSQFIRNLIEQTFVYALGRELDYYDEGPIATVTADLAKNEHRFSTLILSVVRSYPFLNRKNTELPSTADKKTASK